SGAASTSETWKAFDDLWRIADLLEEPDRLGEVLEAGSGVEDDDRLPGGDGPLLSKMPRSRQGRSTLGTGVDPFAGRHPAGRLHHLMVRDRQGRAAALPYRTEHQKVTEARGNAQAGRRRARLDPGLGGLAAALEGPHDRRAAGRLDRDHARPPPADPPEGLHLLEGLPHADQPRPPASRIDDPIRQPEARLL